MLLVVSEMCFLTNFVLFLFTHVENVPSYRVHGMSHCHALCIGHAVDLAAL